MVADISTTDLLQNLTSDQVDIVAEALLESYDNSVNAANDLADAFANRAAQKPGAFELRGNVYLVVYNKQKTRLYAKIMTSRVGGKATFDYSAGAIYDIKESMRMSLARAEELSALVGYCIICGAELTAAKSVKRSIGPVCAKKYF